MTLTYDPNLTSDVDWVRFLIRDVDLDRAMTSDEEITAFLAKQTAPVIARRYYAAAEILASLHVQWMSAGRGRASKRVGQLNIVYGSGGINTDLAIQAHISFLRKEGARLTGTRPYPFKSV